MIIFLKYVKTQIKKIINKFKTFFFSFPQSTTNLILGIVNEVSATFVDTIINLKNKYIKIKYNF